MTSPTNIQSVEGDFVEDLCLERKAIKHHQPNGSSFKSPSAGYPTEPGMSAGYWLGVDLGGTKILSGLFDDDLKLLARSKQPTSADGGPVAVFGRIVQGV